ncbi:hypothetical protein D3C72_1680870 [compost metagenome]
MSRIVITDCRSNSIIELCHTFWINITCQHGNSFQFTWIGNRNFVADHDTFWMWYLEFATLARASFSSSFFSFVQLTFQTNNALQQLLYESLGLFPQGFQPFPNFTGNFFDLITDTMSFYLGW